MEDFTEFLIALVLGVGFAILAAYPTMLLWNWLAPLFGLPSLGFWQTLGLMVLVRFLIPNK